MKTLRCLFAIFLLCGYISVAKADPVPDFQFSVQDPAGNPVYVDPGVPFVVNFDTCPRNITADGCFFGYNESDVTLTSLFIEFADTPGLEGQSVSCSSTLFAASMCTAPGPGQDDFTLSFTGGTGITPGMTFVFAETGASPDAFQGTALAGPTPEPGSIWLLASGALLMAILFVRRQGGWGLGSLS